MRILTMNEFQSLTERPKEIDEHFFSIAEREILDDYDNVVGYDIIFGFDGKIYRYYQPVFSSAYYTFIEKCGGLFDLV